ncbi:MAG TPA: protein kinase [Anaeromyxobacter sp.]
MAEDRGDGGGAPTSSAQEDEDLRDVSAELSRLLAQLARTPEAEVDVAAGWTPALKPGDVVAGRFELRRELGRGGFGVVYEALDRELGREVAFKAVLPGRRVASRDADWVQREAKAVACLNHPNIVTLHDLGAAPSGPYLIFELLRGETLAKRMRRGPFAPREAIALATQVARVLDHAHRAGVVHRDLKPGNVFLCEGGRVKVLDFGLAHLFGRGGPVSGGTPAYMAPEQWRSEPGDERSDLFSLGVLLHRMLAGGVPYPVSRDGSRERSAAEQPGPPPELPKGVAPERVRRLVRRLLEKDPARRPQRAADVLAELERVQRRLDGKTARARAAWAGGLLALAFAGALAWEAFAPPSVPFVVAVADFDNGTGERDMDGLSGLLTTSLEQSRQLQILPRWRLLSLVRELKLPDSSRIEGDVARSLARAAGAKVLLRGAARRVGDAYAIELEAVDPVADRGMFSLVERAPMKAGVFGALDRIADGVRRKLHDATEEGRPLDRTVTASIEAYRAYWAGVDCLERPSAGGSWISAGRCAVHFQEALARDPGFALASYQLAFLLYTEDRPREDVDANVQAALRGVDRMPAREAALVRAWAAHVAGRDDEALETYRSVLRDFPDDRQALYLAGHVLFVARRWAEAVPYLEKTLQVDPGAEWPLDDLVTALAVLRRRDELTSLVDRSERAPPAPARSHAVVRARVWLGDTAGAVAAAREAVEQGWGPAAELDLAGALFVTGELAEAEAVLESVRAQQPTDGGTAYALARAMGAQGRIADGLDVIDRQARIADQSYEWVPHYVRAMYVAGSAEPKEVWREAASAHALDPSGASELAVVLAMRGDLEHAAKLAGDLAPGSAAAEELAAMVAWRTGDAEEAAARLAAVEAHDPWPPGVPPPAYLLAEVSAGMQDWRGTLAAVERFRALWPRGVSGAWTLPRASYLAALAHERLGDADAARGEARRLAGWLRHADRGHRLAEDARTLRKRLGP